MRPPFYSARKRSKRNGLNAEMTNVMRTCETNGKLKRRRCHGLFVIPGLARANASSLIDLSFLRWLIVILLQRHFQHLTLEPSASASTRHRVHQSRGCGAHGGPPDFITDMHHILIYYCSMHYRACGR